MGVSPSASIYKISLWLVLLWGTQTSGEPLIISALQSPYTCVSNAAECILLENQKRAQETVLQEALESSLPCSCEATSRLQDLGREYYPRYLPSVECGAGGCWRGLYRCRQRHYEVKVLKRRDSTDEILHIYDLSLPESLRDDWKFILVKVTVSCDCSL